MQNFVAWWVKNPVAANLLMLGIIISGWLGLKNVEKEAFPSVNPALVQVEVAWQGASPFGVDLLATAAILSLILAAILQPLQRRALLKNTDLLIGAHASPKSLITWDRGHFHSKPWLTTFAYYPLTGLLAATLTLGVLSAFGVENFSALEYSLFKGAWTGVWAALLARQIIKGCAAGMINEQRIEELDRS